MERERGMAHRRACRTITTTITTTIPTTAAHSKRRSRQHKRRKTTLGMHVPLLCDELSIEKWRNVPRPEDDNSSCDILLLRGRDRDKDTDGSSTR